LTGSIWSNPVAPSGGSMSNTTLKGLKVSVLRAWAESISPEEETTVLWGTLSRIVEGFRNVLGDDLHSELSLICKNRDVLAYLTHPGARFEHQCAGSFFAVNQVISLLKKYPFGKLSNINTEEVALRRMLQAEVYCRVANKRLRYFDKRWHRTKNKFCDVGTIINDARLKIHRWLGPLDLNKVYAEMRHGPGGSVGINRPATTAYFKYAHVDYSVSSLCRPYAEAAILANSTWRRSLYCYSNGINEWDNPFIPPGVCREIVRSMLTTTDYNLGVFVPKNAKTDRFIAKEPTMNVYVQLGVGGYLKRVLSRLGTDLSDQSRNQRLAQIGSRDHLLPSSPATLDMEMASDTLCTELVRQLLPEDWFSFLSDIRSPYGEVNGQRRKWDKFSSMGNGFTFELESLIFYALSRSTLEFYGSSIDYLSVYGDDIIVPRDFADRVVNTLRFCGFRINKDKSFIDGPFRESCGEDYFEGHSVRALQLKRKLQFKKDIVFLANAIRFRGTNYGKECFDDRWSLAYDFVVSRLPKVIVDNLLNPQLGFGDGALGVDIDSCHRSPLVRMDKKIQTLSYPLVQPHPKRYGGITSFRLVQFLEPIKEGCAPCYGTLTKYRNGENQTWVDVQWNRLASQLMHGFSSSGSRSDVTKSDDVEYDIVNT